MWGLVNTMVYWWNLRNKTEFIGLRFETGAVNPHKYELFINRCSVPTAIFSQANGSLSGTPSLAAIYLSNSSWSSTLP